MKKRCGGKSGSGWRRSGDPRRGAARAAFFVRWGTGAVLLGAMAALAPAGCDVGPDYQRPALRIPAEFKTASTQPAARIPADWWKLFGDTDLTRLEEAALKASPTLQAAAERVLEARAMSRNVKSQFYPLITGDPSATRSRKPVNGSGSTGNSFEIPIDLTYEVDVWGRVRRTYENAQATAQATADDYYVVLQTLTADVAQDYYQLRGLDAQDQILTQSVQSYYKQIDLIQRQMKAGLASNLDLAQAQALLSSSLASQVEVRRQRADMEHALAVLTGRPPSDLSIAVNPLTGDPPAVPGGLPMDLLRQRPDVAEAEQNLVAANANVGVATANFYPVFNLSGAAGFESVDVQHLLDWENRFWSLGPNMSFPIFEGGKLRADLDQAKEHYGELEATFRATLLTAFQDVEDSLSDLRLYADSIKQLNAASIAAADALRLSTTLYRQGIDNYLQVLDADRTLLTNQISQVQTNTLRYVSTVLLIKAMGGGWEDTAKGAATQAATLPAEAIAITTTAPASQPAPTTEPSPPATGASR